MHSYACTQFPYMAAVSRPVKWHTCHNIVHSEFNYNIITCIWYNLVEVCMHMYACIAVTWFVLGKHMYIYSCTYISAFNCIHNTTYNICIIITTTSAGRAFVCKHYTMHVSAQVQVACCCCIPVQLAPMDAGAWSL